MKPKDARTGGALRAIRPLATLIALAVVSASVYAALAVLSFQFGPGSEPTQRPILAVLGLFGLTFICYLLAIRVALRAPDGTRLAAVILATSVLMRAVSLFSWPILEIDINRYIWDGAVTLEGISPYRYSPQQVLSAGEGGQVHVFGLRFSAIATPNGQKMDQTPTLQFSGQSGGHLPEDLRHLVELPVEATALGTILSRIHYGELPTIYPPVSQAAFALAVFVTPADASPLAHVLVMKTLFVIFDMATLLVVIGLLRLAGKHVGWSVAYGWCPLIIKEIANSGHLDSLAVLLTTLALYFATRPLARGIRARGGRTETMVAAVLLALAVGAKLYPIVLLPLFVMLWSRTHGWRGATVGATVFLATATTVLWPMVPLDTAETPPPARPMVADGDVDQSPLGAGHVEPQDPSGALKAFFRRWEINDFLFMLAFENLKPTASVDPAHRAWFSIVPEPWKAALLSIPSQWLLVDETEAAFHLARALTGAVFVSIVGLLLGRAAPSLDPAVWLRVAFLTLAWLWLLSPTQNPWYWTWALPLVMFAGNRAWLAVSGLTMVYYLRFWLGYHWPQEPLLGTPYAGETLFDLVVTWIEFAPWLLWLAISTARNTTSTP